MLKCSGLKIRVKFAKHLRTPTLKNINERVLLDLGNPTLCLAQKYKKKSAKSNNARAPAVLSYFVFLCFYGVNKEKTSRIKFISRKNPIDIKKNKELIPKIL